MRGEKVKASKYIKNYAGSNPFSDSQARNFSDNKVSSEFYPISQFWTLFNDQHEILLGTRGCGKTFLLKMMRYSMLKKMDDPKARKLVTEKEYIALYVPMHLEFVAFFNDLALSEEQQIMLFQFGFNCKLAEALITELISLLEDIADPLEKAKKTVEIVEYLTEVWFGKEDSAGYEFESLSSRIVEMYYTLDKNNTELNGISSIFKRQICAPLLAVKTKLKQILNLSHEPTWIVCIDEAEFLNSSLQKCINNVFRSDSNRIALKVATLPYYHKTLETLVENVLVADGNDFSFRVVDLAYDSDDFIALTNKLCSHRLKKVLGDEMTCDNLESFLGKIGNDDQIDYYREEVGIEQSRREVIENGIVQNFSDSRKKGVEQYSCKRKTIYDKYAPIYFLREMYKLTKEGNRKPGWYAGAKNVRKVAQGNPRRYIQVMSELFERARKTDLSPKIQHEVIMKFANRFCDETQALEGKGPVIYKELNNIAESLHKKVHDEYLRTIGTAFKLDYKKDRNKFSESKEWLELAIAYSRVIVSDEVKICGIKEDTKFNLSNMYAIKYWLPMRSDSPEKISIEHKESNSYIVKRCKQQDNYKQLSLFDEVDDD